MNPERLARQVAGGPPEKEKTPEVPEKSGLCFDFIGSGSCKKGEDCPHLHGFWAPTIKQRDGDDPNGLDFIFGIEDPDRARGRARGRGRGRGRGGKSFGGRGGGYGRGGGRGFRGGGG